jgi:hypothetical protein
LKIARISSYAGYFTAISFLLFLIVSLVIPPNLTIAQTKGQFPESIIASSSTDTTPHLLELKGTQQGGVETRISDFSLDTTNAIGAQANSQLLVLVTDSALRVSEAKARTASNQVFNLPPIASQQASAFSLANLPGGVYTLDVITQKDDSKAAYGGVLSIGNQPATVIEETTKRVTNDYGDLILIFLPPEECPAGTTGIPPDCEPISCDIENPPPECEEPIVCSDGSTVPPGEECPPDPCDVPNPPPECEEPPPDDDPCDVPNPPPECEEPPPDDDPPDDDPPDDDPPDGGGGNDDDNGDDGSNGDGDGDQFFGGDSNFN